MFHVKHRLFHFRAYRYLIYKGRVLDWFASDAPFMSKYLGV